MPGTIRGRVSHDGGPVSNATVDLHDRKPAKGASFWQQTQTDSEGVYEFSGLPAGTYWVQCTAFGQDSKLEEVEVRDNETAVANLRLELGLAITVLRYAGKGGELEPCSRAIAGQSHVLRVEGPERVKSKIAECSFTPSGVRMDDPCEEEVIFHDLGPQTVIAAIRERSVSSPRGASVVVTAAVHVSEPATQMVGGQIRVELQRTKVPHTRDQALWSTIRLHTRRIGFGPYREFINRVLCAEEREPFDNPALERRLQDVAAPLHGVGAYEVLRLATEAFLLMNCGVSLNRKEGDRRFFHRESESVRLGEPVTFDFVQHKLREYLGTPPQLPYITRVIRESLPGLEKEAEDGDRVLTCRINEPCLIELIWSYWHEEGMLAQSMNAVTRRFQNVRAPGDRDPLAHLEIDPLRPLNNIIWGFIQDEFRRLTVKRRAYEYEHHYGLTLYGRAVSHMRPADSRSKFLEAFHNLLHLCSVFFKEDNDTTVIADGYPLLNALKEVHLLLAQGAHNQFGDLPWTARSEMMLQQWMLARPEIRDFIQSRIMVPYKEAWMPQVDTMKTLQGWSDVSVTSFSDLGVYGEQILLSIRYGDWIAINDEDSAKNWARYWRPEIQAYLHAYRAVTGVDLTNPDMVDATVPSAHLQKRLALQQQRAR